MAASCAPHVAPPTMKPFETSPPRSAACAAVHFSAFSGASRYEKEISRTALPCAIIVRQARSSELRSPETQ
jgi:hypothetical protein